MQSIWVFIFYLAINLKKILTNFSLVTDITVSTFNHFFHSFWHRLFAPVFGRRRFLTDFTILAIAAWIAYVVVYLGRMQ